MTAPKIGGIYVRGITEESHGNATGMGNADVMPRRLLNEIGSLMALVTEVRESLRES